MKKNLYIVLSFLVFVYLTLRAIYVPLVHDEIATFFYYIQQLDVNPLAGANPDANNHILNSYLSGISHKLFGYSAFSIRLPNLLSFILYAFFVFKIGQFLTKKWTQIVFYLSLLFAAYFVQFFALSRGYGMSMAFLFGVFYHVLCLYKKTSVRHLSFGLLFSLLAVYANMSLLPIILLLAVGMKFLALKEYKSFLSLKKYAVSVPVILLWLVGVYYAIKISFKMKEEGSLYYGELDGFWEITIKSQLLMLFENDGMYPQVILFIGLLIMAMIYFNLLYAHKISSIFKSSFFFFYMLLGSIVGIELMAILLEVNYPEDRVGMYLIPLFIGAFCFGVDAIEGKRMQVVLIPLLLIPLHFIYSLNLKKTSLWKYGYIPERFYQEIKNEPDQNDYATTVGGDGQRIFIYTEKLYVDTSANKPNMMQLWQKSLFDTNLNIKVPNHPAQYFDYLICKPKYVKDILPLYDSIDYAELTEFRLYKRKKKAQKIKLKEFKTDPRGESDEEFVEFYHEYFDSLDYDALQLGLKLNLQSLRHPFRARVVAELKYKDGEQIDYQFFQLNWMYPKMVKENTVKQSFIFNNLKHYLQKGPLELKLYLWNIDKQRFGNSSSEKKKKQIRYTLYGATVEEFGVYN